MRGARGSGGSWISWLGTWPNSARSCARRCSEACGPPWASAPVVSPSPSSSVLRKRAASGPSLMLARLPLSIPEDLLCELAVGVCGLPVRVVLEHGHALHGGLREPHRLCDARGEHLVAEVLLEELDRLLGVDGTRVHQRWQDALDVDVRVQVLPDHAQRVLELDQAAHGQIL